MGSATRHEGTTALARDIRELGAFIRHEWRVLLVAIICAVLGPVSALTLPFAAKLVIDDVIVRGRGELLLPIALTGGLAVMVQSMTLYGTTQAGAVAGHRAITRLRQRLQRQALRLPVAYFDRTSTGKLVSSVMGDVECVRILFGPGMLELMSGCLTSTLAFAVLCWLDWRFAALVAVGLVIGAAVLARGFGALQPAFRAVSELQAELAGRLTEVLGGVRVVKACAAERWERHAFARDNHRLLRASVHAHRYMATLAATIALASGGASLAVVVLGGQAVVSNVVTLGDLALFIFLIGLLGTPLTQIGAVCGELGRAFAALGRIREVLALANEEAQDRGKLSVRTLTGAVTFEDVSYGYVPERLVLQHVSFHTPAGATVAISGPNGSGKSTLLSLLAGFDDPTAGQIRVDGKALNSLDRAAYRRHLGIVLQRDHLIDGTIADNIRYARPSATMAEVRRAVRLAHCDEFVEVLPEGYATVVGERGVRLSGGQRQRVAIARALLLDPRILLLDEATVHLDAECEWFVQDAIAMLCGGRTTFVIAHGLATIRRADQVLELRGGLVVDRGVQGELASGNGQTAGRHTAQRQSVNRLVVRPDSARTQERLPHRIAPTIQVTGSAT